MNRFESVHEYGTEVNIKDLSLPRKYQTIILSHYPILSWNKAHHGSWHLHGHCHQSLVKSLNHNDYYKRKVLDIGCNGWDYTPLSYQDLKPIMDKKETSTHH